MTPEKFKKMTLRLIAKALRRADGINRQAVLDRHLARLMPGTEGRRLRHESIGKSAKALRIRAFTIRLAQARGIDLNKSGRGGSPDRNMMKRANDNHSFTVKEDTPCAATWQGPRASWPKMQAAGDKIPDRCMVLTVFVVPREIQRTKNSVNKKKYFFPAKRMER